MQKTTQGDPKSQGARGPQRGQVVLGGVGVILGLLLIPVMTSHIILSVGVAIPWQVVAMRLSEDIPMWCSIGYLLFIVLMTIAAAVPQSATRSALCMTATCTMGVVLLYFVGRSTWPVITGLGAVPSFWIMWLLASVVVGRGTSVAVRACTKCGYDLRGLPVTPNASCRCPECGTVAG